MKPKNKQQAMSQVKELLIRRLPGRKRGIVADYLDRAATVAGEIFGQSGEGVYSMQLKDVRRYLTTSTLKPGTLYKRWRALKVVLQALEKNEWLCVLERGPWVRPTGKKGVLRAGRPPMNVSQDCERRFQKHIYIRVDLHVWGASGVVEKGIRIKIDEMR